MVRTHYTFAYLIMILAVMLTSPATSRPAAASTNEVCVPQAKYCIPGRLGQYWQENGGLPIFGMPMSAPALETYPDTGHTYMIQWVERGRLEQHDEQQPPYEVLLTRLGADRLQQLGRNWQAEGRESGPKAGCLWFEQTGHNVCDQEPNGTSAAERGFKSYWETEGLADRRLNAYQRSLALHGLPLTEARMETNARGQSVLTQWFERGRFEWHPNNPGGSRVVPGMLGNEVRENLPGRGLKYFWPTMLPAGFAIQGDQSSANEGMFVLKVAQGGGGPLDATIRGGVGSEDPKRAGGQTVTVRGRQGAAYTTGAGYSVFWEEDGHAYAITGGLGLTDVLNTAEALEAFDLATFQRRLPSTRTPAP